MPTVTLSLTEADKLLIARDTLRGRESDYFRATLSDKSPYANDERKEAMEVEILDIQKSVAALEKSAAKEADEIERSAKADAAAAPTDANDPAPHEADGNPPDPEPN